MERLVEGGDLFLNTSKQRFQAIKLDSKLVRAKTVHEVVGSELTSLPPGVTIATDCCSSGFRLYFVKYSRGYFKKITQILAFLVSVV